MQTTMLTQNPIAIIAVTLLIVLHNRAVCAPLTALQTPHGDSLPAACSPKEQKRLASEYADLPAKQRTDAAFLLRLVLCEPASPSSHATLRKRLAARIEESVSDTGFADEVRTVKASREIVDRLLVGGNAWDARVQAAPDQLELTYYPNEVCVRTLTAQWRGTQWIVTRMGEACD